jgi:FkbM family methyltransferase
MYRRRPMVSYSQNCEDVILDRVFRDVEVGFYVDVGANDPVQFSITKHFYDHRWRGINIEPGLVFEKLIKERPEDINLNIAISTEPGMFTLQEFPDAPCLSNIQCVLPEGVLSALGDPLLRQVAALPLRTVFAKYDPPEITFLSVDVEGHEREVLLSNDWQRYRPRVLVIEATLPMTPTPSHHLWEDVLLAAGYQFAFFDGLNRYYVRDEDAPLRERFNAPANVFDDFRRVDIVERAEQLAEARAINQQLQEQLARLQEGIAQLAEHNAHLGECLQ